MLTGKIRLTSPKMMEIPKNYDGHKNTQKTEKSKVQESSEQRNL